MGRLPVEKIRYRKGSSRSCANFCRIPVPFFISRFSFSMLHKLSGHSEAFRTGFLRLLQFFHGHTEMVPALWIIVFSVHHSCNPLLLRLSLFKCHAVNFSVPKHSRLIQTCIVHNNSFRLIFSYDPVQFIQFPVFFRFTPVSIKPESPDLAIISADYFYRLAKILQILLEIIFKIFVMPV